VDLACCLLLKFINYLQKLSTIQSNLTLLIYQIIKLLLSQSKCYQGNKKKHLSENYLMLTNIVLNW
jgi:hypothetical protein